MTALEQYIQDQAELAKNLRTLLARTPEQEYKYGGDFTGTREDFSARVVAYRYLGVTATTVIDKILITSPINHTSFRFNFAYINNSGATQIPGPARFIIELSNNNNQWKDGQQVVVAAPSFIATVVQSQNVATGVITTQNIVKYEQMFVTRHKFMRVTLGRWSSEANQSPTTINSSFAPVQSDQPFFEFYGE